MADPDAQMSVGVRAKTSKIVWGAGDATWVQAPSTPTLCNISPCWLTGSYWPTAQASASLGTATPKSIRSTGIGTMFHWLPFQCTVKFRPTAQMLLAEDAPMRLSVPVMGCWRLHDVPS